MTAITPYNPKNTVALCCGAVVQHLGSAVGLWLLCIEQDLSAVPSWSQTSFGDHKINGIGMNWIPSPIGDSVNISKIQRNSYGDILPFGPFSTAPDPFRL